MGRVWLPTNPGSVRCQVRESWHRARVDAVVAVARDLGCLRYWRKVEVDGLDGIWALCRRARRRGRCALTSSSWSRDDHAAFIYERVLRHFLHGG